MLRNYLVNAILLVYSILAILQNQKNQILILILAVQQALLIILTITQYFSKKNGSYHLKALEALVICVIVTSFVWIMSQKLQLSSLFLSVYSVNLIHRLTIIVKLPPAKFLLIQHAFALLLFSEFLYFTYEKWFEWVFLFIQQPLLHLILLIDSRQDSTNNQIEEPVAQNDFSEENQTISQLQDVFNYLPFGIIILDDQSNIVNFNTKLKKYLGFDKMKKEKTSMQENDVSRDHLQIGFLLSQFLSSAYKQSLENDDPKSNNLNSPNGNLDIHNLKFKPRDSPIQKKNLSTFTDYVNLHCRKSSIEIVQHIFMDIKQNQHLEKSPSSAPNGLNQKILKIKMNHRIFSISIYEMMLKKPQNNPPTLHKHTLIIIENITNKESFRMMHQKHRFESLLLNSFSHELRTPVNCSLQLQQMLAKKVSPIDNVTYLQPSIISLQKLCHQINDILDYASLESDSFLLKTQEFSIDRIFKTLHNYYDLEAKKKSITLKMDCIGTTTSERITNDPERIIQILVNLMDNAMKFTKEFGTIKLVVKRRKSTYLFSIQDDGVGIGLDKLHLIQAILKQQGRTYQNHELDLQQYVGLGLKISNRIARFLRKKGSLAITSSENQYTEVNFRVKNFSHVKMAPVLPSPPNEIEEMHEEADLIQQPLTQKSTFFNRHRRSTRILICDDVPFNHIALQTILDSFKLQVDNAYDGYQAIEKIKHKDYSLIFMDVEMPGIDGFETSKQIVKKKNEETVVIMCSAYDSQENIQRGFESGMREILGKPVSLKQLESILRKYEVLTP